MSDSNLQALQAISVSQQVTANNVANMNTDGFRSSRVEYETGPDGQGVRVSGIYENTSPGTGPTFEETWTEGSNTDLATEMVQMIENEQAFAANAVAIHTDMDMSGVLIDMMV